MNRALLRAVAVVVLSTTASWVAVSAPAGASPSSSSNGGLIAFGSDRYGGTHNIFTMNADGSDVHQLTFVKIRQGADLQEQWSPDATQLVFVNRNTSGSIRQIWVMNADGSDQHLVLNDPDYRDFDPSYTPDGSRIAFRRCQPDFEACALYGMKADGSDLTAITRFDRRHNIIDAEPKYSPDGKTLAFTSYNRGGVIAAIYLMNTDGGRVRRLTRPRWSAQDPDWAPNSSRLTFATNCCVTGAPAIWSIGADGSGPAQLTHPGSQHFDFLPDYSPDGSRIAFEVDSFDGSSNVMTMNADGSDRTLIQRDAFIVAWQPVG